MIIENTDKIEYYNCPNCDADITQEEIDTLHCKSCNEDINFIKKSVAILNAIVDKSKTASEEDITKAIEEHDNLLKSILQNS
jgi:reverse gyrase